MKLAGQHVSASPPLIPQICLLILPKHISDPCRGHRNNCSLQDWWHHLSCTAERGCTEALIETDSSVPSDKQPERHWLWMQMGYTFKISTNFLSAFVCPLLLFSKVVWMRIGLLLLRWWWRGEGRSGCVVIWVERWMYLGSLNPQLQTLVIFPGGELLTLPLFWLGVSESLLISQWEIHIHTYLSSRLFWFSEKHCTVGLFVRLGWEPQVQGGEKLFCLCGRCFYFAHAYPIITKIFKIHSFLPHVINNWVLVMAVVRHVYNNNNTDFEKKPEIQHTFVCLYSLYFNLVITLYFFLVNLLVPFQ